MALRPQSSRTRKIPHILVTVLCIMGTASICFGAVRGVDRVRQAIIEFRFWQQGYDGCRCEFCFQYYSGFTKDFSTEGIVEGFFGVLLLVAAGLIWAPIALANHRARRLGQCPHGHDDLTALPTGKCPECGRNAD